MMEAKVKGTLSYHGNLSDFPASRDEMFSWLMGSAWWESPRVVTGLLFLSMFTFSSQALWWGGKGTKTLLGLCRVQEEETHLCKVSDLWSLLEKDRVTMLTDLRETQLSNPQKYKLDFSRGEEEGSWEDLGKRHPSWGLDLNTCRRNCIIKAIDLELGQFVRSKDHV